MPPVRTVEVTAAEAGQKLLQFLERRLGREVPRSALMRWIRTGQVRVDGGRAKPFDRIDAGQAVRIPPHQAGPVGQDPAALPTPASAGRDAPHHPPNPHPERGVQRGSPPLVGEGPGRGQSPLPGGEGSRGEAKPLPWPPEAIAAALGFPVAYQDGELLVLAKPAGLPTQPGSGWTDSVATRLKGLGGDFAPTPVHRLDKDTSGLLLAARTYGCLRRLQDLLRDRLAGKVYLAWVEGRLTPGVVLELRDRLAKAGPAGRERVQAGMEEGKEALAEALPLAVRAGGGGEATLVAVRLLTGRTHQIRVQLASRGHAVVGDRKYGGPGRGRAGGLLLHAWRLDLPERTFELAPDWAGAWTVREEDLAAAREWADR